MSRRKIRGIKFFKHGVALVGAGLLPATVMIGQAAAQEVSVESVDQRLRVLERKLELDKEAAAAKAKDSASASSNASASGFSVSSADNAYALQFRFIGQADGRFFFNDDKADSGDTFYLRRVRPSLSGTVGKNFEFLFTPEFAGGDAGSSSVSLLDLWGAIKLNPAFNIKIGKYTVPVVVEPGSNRHFNESPFTNSLAPNRDIGVEFYGSPNAFLDYRIGVFNGSRNDTSSTNGDANNHKSVVGRLTVKPFAASDGVLKSLALSVGASTGTDSGAGTTSGVASVSRRSFFSYGSNQLDGRHTRISPAITLYSGPFSFVGEYIIEKAEYAAGFEAENNAWRSSIGYVLTGESSAGNVNPKRPFATGADGWGAFELVAFVSGIEFGDELFSTYATGPNGGINPAAQAREATAFGIGANWYLTRNVSLRLNLERTKFDDAYLRDGSSADTEQAASLRFQVTY